MATLESYDGRLAMVRAVGYGLLAQAFAYPDAGRVAALQETARAAEPILAGTPLGELASWASDATQAELEPVYAHVLSLSSSPDCPSYETGYIDSDVNRQVARMADISGFYRAFGVDATVQGFRHDDISVELEFMSFLCKKQVYAAEHRGAPRVAQVARAQRLFLSEHLSCWAGELGRRLSGLPAASGFYARLGEALTEWVAADCAITGAVPALALEDLEPISGGIAPAEPEGPDLDIIPLGESEVIES